MSYDASYPPPVEFFRIVLKSSFPLFVSLLCFVYSFGFVELKAQASSAPTRFTITDTQGLAKFPTFTKYEKTEILTIEEAEEIFKFIKENTNIEFKYSYGGCEKRAHAISLFLNEKKVKHYKIWNFDPSLISIFNKSQEPTIFSKAGLSPTISWRYHVAILIFVKGEKEPQPFVIDPSIDDTNLLAEEKWLTLQNTPNSYYIHLDPQWYNFATTDKYALHCNNAPYKIPPCLKLLTGDFFLNTDISLSDMWVEEALAVNELGIKIIQEIIDKEPSNSNKKKALIELVENFENLTAALKGNSPDNLSPYPGILTPYQNQFIIIRNMWKLKLDELRKNYPSGN